MRRKYGDQANYTQIRFDVWRDQYGQITERSSASQQNFNEQVLAQARCYLTQQKASTPRHKAELLDTRYEGLLA